MAERAWLAATHRIFFFSSHHPMSVEAKDLQPVTPKTPHLSVELLITATGTDLHLGDPG